MNYTIPERMDPALAHLAFPPVEGRPMTPRRWHALACWWRLYSAETNIFRRQKSSPDARHRGAKDYIDEMGRRAALGLPAVTHYEYLASRYFRLTFRMEGRKVRFL